MHDLRLRIAASTLALPLALIAVDRPIAAAPQSASVARVVGSYVATHLTGSSVVRLELSLDRTGRARLRTGASRYSQRPEGVDGREVIETGTWRLDGSRVIVHIEKSSADASEAPGQSKPTYADRSFVLAGCELKLVGSAFAFDKQHCT